MARPAGPACRIRPACRMGQAGRCGRDRTGRERLAGLRRHLLCRWRHLFLSSAPACGCAYLTSRRPGRRDLGIVGRGGVRDEAEADCSRVGQGPRFCRRTRALAPGWTGRSWSGLWSWSWSGLWSWSRSGLWSWSRSGLWCRCLFAICGWERPGSVGGSCGHGASRGVSGVARVWSGGWRRDQVVPASPSARSCTWGR